MNASPVFLVAAVLFLSPAGAWAQAGGTATGIGQIVAPPVKAQLRSPPNPYGPATKGAYIPENGSVKTEGGGNAELYLSDIARVERAKQSIAVLAETELGFRPKPSDPSVLQYVLTIGSFRWVGQEKPVEVKPGENAIIRALGTAFIVRYQPSTDTVEVVGMYGTASVTGKVAGVTRPLVAGQLAVVIAGGPPRIRTLSDDEYARYVRPFELLRGGKPESQVVDDPALGGATVPAPERAPVVGGPAPPRSDGPWRERGPFIDQPPPVIDSTDLGIQF